MYKMSNHLTKDRIERVNYIFDNVGFGNVVYKRVSSNAYGEKIEAITDTGVLMVLDKAETTIITMYLVSIEKATAVFGKDRMSNNLYKTIVNNKKIMMRQP